MEAERTESALRLRSLWAAVLTACGTLVLVVSLGYGVVQIRTAQARITELSEQAAGLERGIQDKTSQIEKLSKTAMQLRQTQEGLLNFLARVSDAKQIHLIGPDVNWEATKASIFAAEPGRRQVGVFGAVLLAWKEIPFVLGGQSLSSGFDSTTFILQVLRGVGIEVPVPAGQRPSSALMKRFEKTATPMPGDLLFYKGNVGHFALLYLGPGASGGQGTCLGTFETGQPVQVLDTIHLNTPVYPFVGYFRVPY